MWYPSRPAVRCGFTLVELLVVIAIVAILAAYPLRRLVQIRPASVFRGEE